VKGSTLNRAYYVSKNSKQSNTIGPKRSERSDDMYCGLFGKSKVNDIWHEKTEYACPKCGAKYTRDNPDLKYCEYCNAKLEEECNSNGNTEHE
jgi:hypothetical protein